MSDKNESLEVMPRDLPPPATAEALISEAIQKGVSVETMERLMAMRRELRAESAKEAFDRAMSAFQSECPVIEKTKKVMNADGQSVRYAYAPLDAIVSQVRALLKANGLGYRIVPEVTANQVAATCVVTHELGHSESASFKVPIDEKAYMNLPQKFASALTFAKRYAFCAALGILTGDEDDDGTKAGMSPEEDSQRARWTKPKVETKPAAATKAAEDPRKPMLDHLWDLLKGVRGPAANWTIAETQLRAWKILEAGQHVGSLTVPQLKAAIDKVEIQLSPE